MSGGATAGAERAGAVIPDAAVLPDAQAIPSAPATLRDVMLATIPRTGIAAKALYQALDVETARIDYALGGLLREGVVVNVGGHIMRREWPPEARCEQPPAANPEPTVPAARPISAPFTAPRRYLVQSCRCCGKLLPPHRFGRSPKGTLWGVCKHCRGQKISASLRKHYGTERKPESAP